MSTIKLSEHFTLEEFLISQTATRLGIDNSPLPEHLENLKLVALALEDVRAHYQKPVIITSGYRSPELNAATPGSSKTSAHPQGFAADFHIIGIPNIEICKWIRLESNITYDQIIYEFGPYPKGWVHLGLSSTPRRMALTAYRVDGHTVYRPGIVEL